MEEDVAREGSVTVLIPFDGCPHLPAWGAELQCCAAVGNALVQGGVRDIS